MGRSEETAGIRPPAIPRNGNERGRHQLTARKLLNATEGYLGDGGGLPLRVCGDSASWVPESASLGIPFRDFCVAFRIACNPVITCALFARAKRRARL